MKTADYCCLSQQKQCICIEPLVRNCAVNKHHLLHITLDMLIITVISVINHNINYIASSVTFPVQFVAMPSNCFKKIAFFLSMFQGKNEGFSISPAPTCKCIYTEGGVKCGLKTLPSSKYCRRHILEVFDYYQL